jgi:hypothetical protein
MFNSLQSQKVIEDQFGRGGIFEGYEGRFISRGSDAPPAPPSTGDRMPMSEGSPANWIREGPRGVGQGQWGLQPDEEDETGEQGLRSDGPVLPLLGDETPAKNGCMATHIGNLKGGGAAVRGNGSASDRGSSRGGRSASSAGSSHRWNCVDDVPLIIRDLCRLLTSVAFDMLSAVYIALFMLVPAVLSLIHNFAALCSAPFFPRVTTSRPTAAATTKAMIADRARIAILARRSSSKCRHRSVCTGPCCWVLGAVALRFRN